MRAELELGVGVAFGVGSGVGLGEKGVPAVQQGVGRRWVAFGSLLNYLRGWGRGEEETLRNRSVWSLRRHERQQARGRVFAPSILRSAFCAVISFIDL